MTDDSKGQRPFVVLVTRTVELAFEVKASSAGDAEARYLTDGVEITRVASSVVDSVEEGTAAG